MFIALMEFYFKKLLPIILFPEQIWSNDIVNREMDNQRAGQDLFQFVPLCNKFLFETLHFDKGHQFLFILSVCAFYCLCPLIFFLCTSAGDDTLALVKSSEARACQGKGNCYRSNIYFNGLNLFQYVGTECIKQKICTEWHHCVTSNLSLKF